MHRHFWKLLMRRASLSYCFKCECSETRWVDKDAFWFIPYRGRIM